MRDWQRYVLENLGPMHLNSAEFEGVAQELAAHLEETYEKLRSSGLSEEQADLQTRAQAGNWKKLRSGVMSAKKEDSMENRVSQLWVPGIVTLFGSAVFFAGLEYMGVHPVVLGPSAILLYVPWLLGLPVFGALGAFLARRAHGGRVAIHLSSAFPALVMVVVMLSLLIGALFINHPLSHQLKTIGFWPAVITWVVLPGAALHLGDIAFQWIVKQKS
ncbi:MAG: hypothetical protein WAK48_08735 [Candidatus Acidiferrum sp.]|jgi:hypothetical protein